jgi:hypothetical protein
MSITYTVALAQLRENLNEPTASTWQDAELLRYLYYGSKQVAQRTLTGKKSTTVSITLGTQTYTAPTDLILIHRASFSATGASERIPLELRAPREMDELWGVGETIARGDPNYISMWGKVPTVTMKLYPTPARSGTLYLDYYNFPALPGTFSTGALGSSTLDVPDGYEDLPILYAELRARRRVQDEQWKELAADFADQLGALEDVAARPHHDQPGQIVMDGGYGRGVGLPWWMTQGGYW